MPNGVLAIITAILGSSGILGVVLNHKLQQRRERDVEKRTQRASWVAQQRGICTGLLDAVIQIKGWLYTLESIHDDRTSRFTMTKTLETAVQQINAAMEPIRKVRRELDLEPNAQLQEAIDQFGDAAIAYHQALYRPLSSPWNPIQFYAGKTPKAELARLAQDLGVRTEALQESVRKYMAQLEQQDTAKRAWWAFWRHTQN